MYCVWYLFLQNVSTTKDHLQAEIFEEHMKSVKYNFIVVFHWDVNYYNFWNILQLMIFESKILRKIFGPTKEVNGLWRIKTNEEPDELIKRKNIIRFIKSERLKWLGHVERMPNEREVTKIFKWKPFASRPKGRPKIDGKMMWEGICRKWGLRIGRRVYWTETHGGQLLSGPKLAKSCSVYQEEEEGTYCTVANMC